jgi:SRSO17 transposase
LRSDRSVRWSHEDVPRGVVLADAAYGNDNGFREGLESLELSYAVGIQSSTTLWPPEHRAAAAPTEGQNGPSATAIAQG